MANFHAGGIGLLSGPAATSGTGPSFAATPSDTLPVLAPNFTAGPTGLDAYRPWHTTVLDGYLYVANGFDQPKRWDGGSNFYDIGAAAPTSFAAADSSGGTTFPSGTVVRYYCVFRNSTTGKETYPEIISHTMSGTKDIDITWTDPGGEYDVAVIYGAPATSDSYFAVETVTASTETYTDGVSDATLRTNDAYVERLRTTLPPIFWGLSSHLNRLWGWVLGETKLYFSQQARTDGELVQEDFPPLNILPIGPEDGLGDIRAVSPHYDSLYVRKQRGCYEVLGDTPETFVVRRTYADRGVLNPRCIVETEGYQVILDDRGLYRWAPGAEPAIAGAYQGEQYSRLEPVWQRMNLGAFDHFFLVHDREARLVKAYVALDYEPVPNARIVYDYSADKFISVDVAVWGTAGGWLEDAFGRTHENHGDDFGMLWEDDFGQSEGVTTGSLTGTVTSGSSTDVTCSGAAFDTTIDGPLGGPYVRGATGSDAEDTNRVAAITGTVITPYYYSSSSVDAGEVVTVGAIPAVAQTGKLSMGTGEKKWVRWLIGEFDSGPSGTLTFSSARDDGSFTLQKNVDLSSQVREIVPINDRCWTWSLRLTQSAADVGFSLRGVRLKVQTFPDRE